jgi:cbb3-type cytochrome oxidase maturation protein
MEILYLLIPLALILVGFIAAAFIWAVRSGQFDDLEGPAHSILMDEEQTVTDDTEQQAGATDAEAKRPK